MKLADIYNIQQKKEEEKKLVVEIPAVSSLLKHLDLLYSIVLKKQIEEENKQEKISWFNQR
jgi:hypothetical protein